MGLCCCTQAFSSCGERGATLHFGAWASRCSGFSCCGALALGIRASVVVARGLHSTGSLVVVHGVSCSAARGIFPNQGSNPCPLHWQADSFFVCLFCFVFCFVFCFWNSWLYLWFAHFTFFTTFFFYLWDIHFEVITRIMTYNTIPEHIRFLEISCNVWNIYINIFPHK